MARSISSIILHHYLVPEQIDALTLEIARDYLSQLHAHLRADLKPFRERLGQGFFHAEEGHKSCMDSRRPFHQTDSQGVSSNVEGKHVFPSQISYGGNYGL